MKPLTCPHCHKKMHKFGAAGNLEAAHEALQGRRLAPIVCDKCASVSIFRGSLIWIPSAEEMEALKKSPAYSIIERMQSVFLDAITQGKVQ